MQRFERDQQHAYSMHTRAGLAVEKVDGAPNEGIGATGGVSTALHRHGAKGGTVLAAVVKASGGTKHRWDVVGW